MIGASQPHFNGPRPPASQIVLAFVIVYLGYGLNFLAVKVGVESLPAFFFAASHVFAAGAVLFTWRAIRQQALWLPPGGFGKAFLAAIFLFVGGVGLVTEGEKLGVASGQAAMLKASVPLWVAVLEALRPNGERPTWLMGAGLATGAAGVVFLVLPRLSTAPGSEMAGILALLFSALLFAIGTVFVRHHPPGGDPTLSATWMMLAGGLLLGSAGLAFGERMDVSASDFTAAFWLAFGFLLLVHSLAAFTALNWLLRHLPAPVVTTKFYVSPAIATLAGFFILQEPVSPTSLGGLGLILAGVALVLWGEGRRHLTPALRIDDADELDE